MVVLSRIVRSLQFCLVLYVSVAIVYATNCFIISPLRSCILSVSSTSAPKDPMDSWLKLFQKSKALPPSPPASITKSDTWLPKLSNEVMYWPTSQSGGRQGVVYGNSSEMTEDLFLSKAFAQSMKPSKIIPFFYRATGTFNEEDITLTTLVTSNRFPVLAQLVERYQGPISVAIHVKNETGHIQALLDSLHALYTSSRHMSIYVDVHLVIDAFDRQFNTWRNIARLFARTEFVMMLDVDFAVCTDFRRSVRESEVVRAKLREGAAALVIPAFEYSKRHEGDDQKTFPTDKKSLLSLVKDKRIGMFHASWATGHNSTDYERYYTAQPGEVYKVTEYQAAYEPYVIFKKEGPPWCDERFVGYGGNKAACLFEMYLSGISFYVLADHFLVHQNHRYEEAARKHERKHNRKIYADFKEETCLRYLKWYYDAGLLNTTRGHNVHTECKKIKGVSRLAAQLIDGL